VGSENVRLLVDTWAIVWTVVMLAGYLADYTPWPAIKKLKDPGLARLIFLSSVAVVLGLTLGGAREASAVLAAWAIVSSSVKLLYDSLGQEE
jgi:hypothetical protein